MKKVFDDAVMYYNEKGQLHKTDGPAVKYYNEKGQVRCLEWRINNKCHRTDGPAIINIDKTNTNQLSIMWCINGKLHRTDGPAVEYNNGDKLWYLNDIEYTEEEHNLKIKLERLKKL